MNDDARAALDASLPPFWKRIVINLFWLGLAGMVVQVILIAFASRWWVADLFTHFRLQAFLLGILLLITSMLLGYRYAAIVLLLLVGLHAGALAPYLPTERQKPLSENARTLLSWNVYVGNGRHEEILAVVRDLNADVVFLMEVSPQLGQKLEQLRDLYPQIEVRPSTDAFGSALLSREPLAELSIERIGDELVNTVVTKFDDGVTLVGAHTLPPAGAHYSRIRNQQLEELADFVKSQEGPVIVAGDLNVSPWSPHFRQFIQDTSLIDTRRGRGILNSWPKARPLTRIPIDHVLVTGETAVGKLTVLSDSHGSDHFPVFCRWEVK